MATPIKVVTLTITENIGPSKFKVEMVTQYKDAFGSNPDPRSVGKADNLDGVELAYDIALAMLNEVARRERPKT